MLLYLATRYLEERSLHFTDVTDLKLNAKPAVIDKPSQVVKDSKEKMIKKKNNCTAKKSKRLAKLCTFVGSPSSSHPKFSSFLLYYSVPIPVPAFVLAPMPALVFCCWSPTILLFCCLPVPVSHSRSPAVLSSCHALDFYCGISTLLLLLSSMLDPPFSLGSSSLKRFKQSLSDESWPRVLTNLTKPFCSLPTLGTYNLTNNNELKWDFDIVFINSRPPTGNYD